MQFQVIARMIKSLRNNPSAIRSFEEEHVVWIDFFAFCNDELLPSKVMTPGILAELICSEIGYMPEGFLNGTSTRHLIDMLSSEAKESIGSELTVWDAVDALEGLRTVTLIAPIEFTKKLSYMEAQVFWSRALGQHILNLGYVASHAKIDHVNKAEMRNFVVTCKDRQKILTALVKNDSSLVKTGNELNPSRPVATGRYVAWRNLTWPEGDYWVSLRKNPIYTLHLFSPMKGSILCHLRDLSGDIVHRYTRDIPIILKGATTGAILIVERYPNERLIVHDILYSSIDPKIHESTYPIRRKHCESIIKFGSIDALLGDATPLAEVKKETSLSHMLVGEERRLYLINDGAYDLGGHDGFIVSGSKGKFPLLIESFGGDGKEDLFVHLAALDGMEDVIVAVHRLGPDNTDVLFALKRRGVNINDGTKHVEEVSHLGIIVEVVITNISTDGNKCEVLSIEKVCDNLGRYNAVQVGELIAVR